ncbi:lytic transglycosylase domain-containing protein [Tengunoibacter tsumagoiensis]|uniref:Transglycosylase SLT domain-containing protein n=1 Tax=Tengunoibacter tsumagoiensis TaxID=2014871 RepID=A0A401ZW51_9CHLR|nr:lytic transglycosylase domain-containing protein [Tengunoibacter tsumagoiensis]GCE11129.1 hypothetical protein KTT_09880 [Tengunoibacter tsumagoiensis]
MPRFPSLRSFKHMETEISGGPAFGSDPDHSSLAGLQELAGTPEPVLQSSIQPMQDVAGAHQLSFAQELSASSSVQTLVQPALETNQEQKAAAPLRARVVIHGNRHALRPARIVVPQPPLPRRLRSGLILGSTFIVAGLILFSLTPLGAGSAGFSFFQGSIKLAEAAHNLTGIDVQGQHAITPTPSDPMVNAPIGPSPMTLSKSQYVDVARQAAAAAGIPADAFVRQIQAESGFNPNAVSPGGAVGIAQFMPSTAAGLGINPYDPVSALNGAARYMANLSASFGGDYAKGLAAYNAGSGAVQRAINAGGADWLAYMNGTTQNYVHTIMGY